MPPRLRRRAPAPVVAHTSDSDPGGFVKVGIFEPSTTFKSHASVVSSKRIDDLSDLEMKDIHSEEDPQAVREHVQAKDFFIKGDEDYFVYKVPSDEEKGGKEYRGGISRSGFDVSEHEDAESSSDSTYISPSRLVYLSRSNDSEDGIYDVLSYNVRQMDNWVGQPEFWKGARLRYDPRGNATVVGENGKPLNGVIFFETVGERDLGSPTRLTCRGARRNGGAPLTFVEFIFWWIGGRLPTEASPDLEAAFGDQVSCLEDFFHMIEGNDDELQELRREGQDVRGFVWGMTNEQGEQFPTVRLVTPQPIYQVRHSYVGAPTRSLTADEARAVVPYPITLDSTFDANVLADHAGELASKHQGARLIQFDMKDVDGELIPPWKVRSELRPGTLVLAQVTFRMFRIKNTDRPGRHYSIQMQRLKVLAESPEDEEPFPDITDSSGFLPKVALRDFEEFDHTQRKGRNYVSNIYKGKSPAW